MLRLRRAYVRDARHIRTRITMAFAGFRLAMVSITFQLPTKPVMTVFAAIAGGVAGRYFQPGVLLV